MNETNWDKEIDLLEAEAALIFEEVDEALGEKLSALIFEGPQASLTMTENAQPAIMATSMVALAVLKNECGFKVEQASFVAGHSLGEYSALCAAGALSLTDAARLLRVRGHGDDLHIEALDRGQNAQQFFRLTRVTERQHDVAVAD